MVDLESAWGIHLECHQFHRPFSISRILLFYVRHRVLSFEGGSCLRFLVELDSLRLTFMRFVKQIMWCELNFQTVSNNFGFLRRGKFEAWSTMNSIWCPWSIPCKEGLRNRPYSLWCDLRITYFCFPHFKWLFTGHSPDIFGDPIDCRFTCWIPCLFPQFS
jgi:hypothetical protein